MSAFVSSLPVAAARGRVHRSTFTQAPSHAHTGGERHVDTLHRRRSVATTAAPLMSVSPGHRVFRRALINVKKPTTLPNNNNNNNNNNTSFQFSNNQQTFPSEQLLQQPHASGISNNDHAALTTAAAAPPAAMRAVQSLANASSSGARLSVVKALVHPLRTVLATTLLLARKLESFRNRSPAAYKASRMALGLSLGVGMLLINRYGLSTPSSFLASSTIASSSAGAGVATASGTGVGLSLPAVISSAVPPHIAAALRPFTEAFGVVFLSEFGDKSMFATALMAMKHSPLIVCVGALGALTVMTFIACFLGQLMHYLPPTVTHYSSIALFVFFGLQMIIQSRSMSDDSERKDAEQMVNERDAANLAPAPPATAAAAATVAAADRKGSPLSVLAKVSSLIFVAEWCDRSMLATMALAASSNTVAVIGGATFANIVCTGMAVCAATLVASKISERMVALIAGILFEVFAVFTYLEGPEQAQ